MGIHPEADDEWSAETAAELAGLYQAGNGKVAAWGEIGLDYHWETIPRARQQDIFAAQIAFAQTLSPTLPLIIHNRDSLADVLAVLKASATSAPIVMHCFTGDTDAAQAVWKPAVIWASAGSPRSRSPMPSAPPSPTSLWIACCWKPTALIWPRSFSAGGAMSRRICPPLLRRSRRRKG